MPAPIWVTLPVPLITPANVTVSLRSKPRTPLSVTLPVMLPARSTIADLQRARANGCPAGVSIGAGQDRRACPNLGDTARAADHSGKGHGVAPIEGQDAIVGDIAGDASSRSTIADLQRSD